MRSYGWLVAALAVNGQTVAIPNAPPLKPTSPWRVDYSETQCVALRNYGTDAEPLFLVLKPSINGALMHVQLIQSGTLDEAREIETKIDFGSIKQQMIEALYYGDDKTKMRAITMNLPMADFRANIAAPTFAIDSKALVAAFALSQTSAVAAELDKCLWDLQRYWGLSGRAPGTIPPEPKGDIGHFFTNGDFPLEAFRKDEEGAVQFVVLVDESGKVAGCDVVTTSGIPVFDAMGCEVMVARGKFRPAEDANRKPVRDTYVTPPVDWRIAD